MRRNLVAVSLAVLFLVVFANSSLGQEVREKPLAPAEIYKRVSPAVVQIHVYDSRKKLFAGGSGFLVTNDGAVVTNLHVVKGAETAEVRFADGRRSSVIGYSAVDQEADLIILRIAEPGAITPLQLASELPPVGSPVYAVGSPQGLTNSLSDGLVSGHRLREDGLVEIQTNAAISQGSSGGPLVGEDGRVVGITTAYLQGGQNLNLAVPAPLARAMLEKEGQVQQLAELATSENRLPVKTSMSDDQQGLIVVQKATSANDWGAAIRLLNQIPSTRRGKGYWLSLAYVQERLGKLTDSYDAYVEAAKIDADSNTFVKLAIAAEQISSSIFWEKSGTEEANDYFLTARSTSEMAIKLDPENAEAHNVYGVLRIIGDEQKAKGALNTAIALEPKNLGARYNLGVLCLRMNDHVTASKHLEESVGLLKSRSEYRIVDMDEDSCVTTYTSSDSIDVLVNLALADAYREQGRFSDAIALCNRVLEMEPNNGMACWGICFAHRVWHGFEDPDALEWERRAKQINVPILDLVLPPEFYIFRKRSFVFESEDGNDLSEQPRTSVR